MSHALMRLSRQKVPDAAVEWIQAMDPELK